MDKKSPRSVRALVVDDSSDQLFVLQMLLGSLRVETRSAPSGPACLKVARDFHPHLIMLDLAMPSMDGFAVAARLFKESLPPFMLVAATGYGGLQIEDRCRSAGFHRFSLKPFGLHQLTELITATRQFHHELDGQGALLVASAKG